MDSLFTSAFWLHELAGIAIVTVWSLVFAAAWAGLETIFPYLKGGFGR